MAEPIINIVNGIVIAISTTVIATIIINIIN
jgi:hypothetical protein